ncbi:glycosyltransferase [Paracoccus panacisoli]|uniref:Glycosyltransferase n=1 Tax=Paracoccus panacisoli TaxID=1510163 RepID=A0ABV6T808_9RHOB
MDRTQPSRRGCVVVCSDANWAWQSVFVLSRSISFDTDQQLDHHIYLTGDVDPGILAAIPPQVVVHSVDSLPEIYVQSAHGRIPPAAMLRLTALSELSELYERVIYLDGDVFQCWGTLGDLLRIELAGSWAAVVRDRLDWSEGFPFGQGRYVKRLQEAVGVPDAPYFNSGVMMIHGPSYRRERVTDRALSFFQTHRDLCRFGDQSALNAAMAGHIAELSPSWNWQMSDVNYALTAGRTPRLIHFTGQPKPWTDGLKLMPSGAFKAMEAFLRENDLVYLLGPQSPLSYESATMERRRVREVSKLMDNTLQKRDLIKAYLDRVDFADIQSGLRAYG